MSSPDLFVSSSLGSEASLCALAVALVSSPQQIKLTEVHVGRDPPRLVRLCCLASSLASEQASIPRAGAGALSLGVCGLQGGCGALTAGESGGAEDGGGGGRWLIGKSGGRRGGGDGYKCWNTGEGESGGIVGGETKERSGKG